MGRTRKLYKENIKIPSYTGEQNITHYNPRGTWMVINWNFPMQFFLDQHVYGPSYSGTVLATQTMILRD